MSAADFSTAPRRQAVLVIAHADGFLEAFAERNIDVHFLRQPAAETPLGERIAEACAELMLPRRCRDVWRRDLLRAVGTSRSLTAETALAALAAKDCQAALEPFTPRPERPRKGAA
ncbi:hypothetical protein [Lacipirellula limnantheis]|uniref:Uncharacterized protein n=1 Tax=Lacipirellula limnantheis TaxID=2528024 RepID=A0A517U4K8_9BACT|nr:hypothetical protein [Lacipirellula limnantheis]QDT75576.1 hypothetical protein I41_47870 [Lacipirellula limnantheis]